MKKIWTHRPYNKEHQAQLVSGLRISPLLARLLVNRGIDDVDSANAFLRPKMTHLTNPLEHPEVEKAARRVVQAIKAGERIAIYGDYDVDGVAGAAILLQFLNLLKANTTWYIPQRIGEGYGLNPGAIEILARDGVKVIITVDCGVTSITEADILRAKGIDLIITDHHEPLRELPQALAIINPRLPGSGFTFREFSGAGLAFKLCWALAEVLSMQRKVTQEFRAFLLDAMGLAALGTIADSVPLIGENRILARYGLEYLNKSTHPGIQALKEVSDLNGPTLSPKDIGFRLGPRLNAAGRLSYAAVSLELLTTTQADKAKRLALYLEKNNRERQKIQTEMLNSTREKIAREIDLGSTRVIVLASESWHPGVIGIIASKVVEEFHRPTILIALRDGEGHGSARSVPTFHLPSALEASSSKLISFGGHSQAAGLKIKEGDIDDFRELINQFAYTGLREEDLLPTLHTDGELPLKDITTPQIQEMEHLAPYGEGNPEPLFVASGLRVVGQPYRIGGQSGQHLSLYLRQGDTTFRAIAYGMGDLLTKVEQHSGPISVAFTPRVSKWVKEGVELDVKDIRFN